MKLFLAAIGMVLLVAACAPILARVQGQPAVREVLVAPGAATAPQLRVRIPSRGANAPVFLVATNGAVQTWSAVDDISVSFHDGVLVATRGLGFDLMGAGAEATLVALQGGGDEVYRRQFRYLTGDHRTTYLTAGCSIAQADAGAAQGQRRFEERCQARDHLFTNVFWLDGSGRILRSQQWVSPQVGHILIDPSS